MFEPDDEYKGDFARSYFYMATAYNDRVANWNSDMLAGNDYPVFSSWALNLLLKWHRQDPVSDKERTRNDAVYAHQRNRNPYIDHPELVEYVWGDKKTMTWNGEDETAGTFTLPVDGSTIDMGTAGTGVPVSKTITVKGQELTGAVTLSATNALQISPATLTAAQANAGAQVTLTWKFSRAGSYSSTLTITSGSAKTTATVRAKVQDGLPAMDATEISAESFTARWTYVGGDTDGKYTLDVRQGGTSIDGYPRAVPAEAGSYTVDGLEPGTTYTYTVSSATLTSNTVTVTTGQLLPCIEFLYDGVLAFYSEPGTPSDPEEILVDIENITSDIAVSVTAPFEISSDRTAWGTSLTLKAAEDRIYMRLNAAAAGEYTTVIKATAGDYTAESGRVSGTCADAAAEFVETFEANFAKTYTTGEYQGSAAKWYISNVGVVGLESQGDRIYAGEKACRFGKEADSYIEMLDGKSGSARSAARRRRHRELLRMPLAQQPGQRRPRGCYGRGSEHRRRRDVDQGRQRDHRRHYLHAVLRARQRRRHRARAPAADRRPAPAPRQRGHQQLQGQRPQRPHRRILQLGRLLARSRHPAHRERSRRPRRRARRRRHHLRERRPHQR